MENAAKPGESLTEILLKQCGSQLLLLLFLAKHEVWPIQPSLYSVCPYLGFLVGKGILILVCQ